MPSNQENRAFSQRLLALLERHGQARHGAGSYLAKRYKVSTVVANAWLNGEYRPSINIATQIAVDHGTTRDVLYFGEDSGSNVVEVPFGSTRIPIISCVEAGRWTEIMDAYTLGEGQAFIFTENEVASCSFALKFKGDSMLPQFKEGDVVVIDPTLTPLPGDYVVAKNNSESCTFKKFRPRGINERGEQVVELVPLNPDYPPIRSDLEPVRIIGVMVEHRQYRKR